MKNDSIIKLLFWTIWIVVVAICSFFIVHNAQWIIGDDAVLMRHTGSGIAFLPSGTTIPQTGRFYPFAYLVYDVLLLFCDGYISAKSHYLVQMFAFVIFAFCMTHLALVVLKELSGWWRYGLSLLFIIVSIGRTIPNFVECYSTIWWSYTLLAVFLDCTCLFFENKNNKWIFGIIALLCVNYMCYTGETGFVLPLSMGVCGLLFGKKYLKPQRLFCWLLVGSALVFLLLYAVLILPNIKSAYEGAHGERVSILGNAIRILYAQKILLLALIVFSVRMIELIRKKSDYCLFDNFLFAAAACCIANFVLRLNWVMYYNGAALICLCLILYFSVYYLKEKKAMVLFVLLALFYGRKIPSTIQKSQNHRREVGREITMLSNKLDEGIEVFWYEPKTDESSYELVLRDWRYASINTYLGWLRQDPDFSLIRASKFDGIDNSIWLSSIENKKLFQKDSCLMKYGEIVFHADSIYGYHITHHDY